MIAGLVLAAGQGRRLGGRAKALLPYRGGLLIEHVLSALEPCEAKLVVTGAYRLPDFPGVTIVHNAQWETGMGSSFRAGIEALPPQARAVVILLADQPGITAAAVERLIQTGSELAVATYAGGFGHPVLIGHSHFAAAADSARGDKGARNFLRANESLVRQVPCDDVCDPADIDLPEDLARLRL